MSESFREEITRLEALYAGNPGGRVFTHLAEAYRKAGQLDRARDILDRGLRHHGDYASAHVVLGRVLMDMGEGDEARAAFRRVIELDRHNMIALRSLGDLAVVASDVDEALRRYRELIALDPTDEHLQATVARLESSVPAAASAEAASPSRTDAVVVDSAADGTRTDSDAEGHVAEDDTRQGEMATETMAELYAAQGLHARAVEVYRSLLHARPGDDRLAERLRQVESVLEGADEAAASVAVQTAEEHDAVSPSGDTPSWLERVESAWTGGSGVAGGGPTPYAWTETAQPVRVGDDVEDRPISAYFESLLAWRPAERRPDQGVDDDAGVEPRDTDARAGTKATEPAVWLDENTADAVRGEAESVGHGGTALTPRDVRRAGTPTVEEDEDLEMFRSWLQSLKK